MPSIRAGLAVALLIAVVSVASSADGFASAVKLGEAYQASEDYDSALREYSAALAIAENDTQRGIALGKKAELYAFQLQDFKSAQKSAEEALALQDAAPVARVTGLKVLARCQMQSGNDYRSAIVTLSEAAKLADVDWAQPSIHLMLGDCFRKTQQFEKAIASYQRVTEMQSADRKVKAIAYLNHGIVLRYDLDQLETALASFAQAAESDPGLRDEIQIHIASVEPPSRRLILAHYMPWYVAKPISSTWGWHWTMNHFNPDNIVEGRHQIAAEYYPLIGPYDSGDVDVLEYHLLLMKMAGIDGVIVDWYGLQHFRDYRQLHTNTKRLIEQVQRLGMKFVICYEDQTIPALVQANRITDANQIPHAKNEIRWLSENWFKLDNYVHVDGSPVLLSFGYGGLSKEAWSLVLAEWKSSVAYFSEHAPREGAAGAFDWPIPAQGLRGVDRFRESSHRWANAIPVVFPRFVDVYSKANVNAGFPRIEDNSGATFRATFQSAIDSNTELIQIATWNDWGEGTQIEPSREFGYRDLVTVQQMRRDHIAADFQPQASDLEMPLQLYRLRKAGTMDARKLDEIAMLISEGDLMRAREAIDSSKDK